MAQQPTYELIYSKRAQAAAAPLTPTWRAPLPGASAEDYVKRQYSFGVPKHEVIANLARNGMTLRADGQPTRRWHLDKFARRANLQKRFRGDARAIVRRIVTRKASRGPEGVGAGYRKIFGLIRAEGIIGLGEKRVLRIMKEEFEQEVARRRAIMGRRIVRREYVNFYSYNVWHVDMNQKSCKYGNIQIAGIVGGKSRYIFCLKVMTTRRASVFYEEVYLATAREHGGRIPCVVVHDAGRENTACHDSAEHFSRLDALLFTATAWILIVAYCFAIPWYRSCTSATATTSRSPWAGGLWRRVKHGLRGS